jgi:hypothetical protein
MNKLLKLDFDDAKVLQALFKNKKAQVFNLCPNCARRGQKVQKISKKIQKPKKFLPSNQLVKNT